MTDRIEHLTDLVLNTCLPWISVKDGSVQFIDPLDNEEISAHYGATHMACALLLYGIMKNNDALIQKGGELLTSVLDRWDQSKVLPGFHNDFNNFALCVIDSFTDKYRDRIRKAVLDTADTVFDTINWLPMRWFVNKCRYEWTGDASYQDRIKSCKEKIAAATYSDGYIDDMLPLGTSFSLQYDVATVAFLQYLRSSGEDIDLGKETGALLNSIFPDGDINYLGRGTNQIFAWGLWIYLLASSGQSELAGAMDYLEKFLPVMLEKNNVFLNDYDGREKYMWWDYHYCSVYTAHLFFWLVLALRDCGKNPITPKFITDGSSGVHIYKNEDVFAVVFDGRTEYLAERGPVVEALWTKSSGMIFKGAFGPWYGLFGNRYSDPDAAMNNHMGFIKPKTKYTGIPDNNVIGKIKAKIRKEPFGNSKPLFITPSVEISEKARITYSLDGSPVMLNIPCFGGNVNAKCDGKELLLQDAVKIKNQYGCITLKQASVTGKNIEIEIT